MSEFHQRGRINREMNVTFLSLIPKANTVELKDYRLISLIGYAYKMLSKILANRLKCVLPQILGPFQRAFITGRQTFVGVLIANELIDCRKKSKNQN